MRKYQLGVVGLSKEGVYLPPWIKFKLFPEKKNVMILDPRRQLSLQIRIYRLNCWRVYIFLFLFDHSLYLVCSRSAVGRGKVILALSSFSLFPYCFYGYVLFSRSFDSFTSHYRYKYLVIRCKKQFLVAPSRRAERLIWSLWCPDVCCPVNFSDQISKISSDLKNSKTRPCFMPFWATLIFWHPPPPPT